MINFCSAKDAIDKQSDVSGEYICYFFPFLRANIIDSFIAVNTIADHFHTCET